jgi:hypothetical protein
MGLLDGLLLDDMGLATLVVRGGLEEEDKGLIA